MLIIISDPTPPRGVLSRIHKWTIETLTDWRAQSTKNGTSNNPPEFGVPVIPPHLTPEITVFIRPTNIEDKSKWREVTPELYLN